MFYMFSGPDFLYANAFYPKATTYVLSALEPVGLGARSDEIAARRYRRGALQRRALDEFDPELQLLHHQAHEDRSARRRRSAAPCRSSMYSWRARARPSATSAWSRSTTRARCIRPVKMPAANATRGVRIMFAGSDGVRKDAVLFLDRSFQQRRQEQRLSEILRNAGARQQPDQERVLSAACRQFHHRARLPARQQRHHHPGRFRHSARRLQSRRNGGSFRSAATPDRSANSPEDIRQSYAELFRRSQPMDFGIGYRWRSYESNLLLSVRLPPDGTGSVGRDAARLSRRSRRNRRARKRPRPPAAGEPRRTSVFSR